MLSPSKERIFEEEQKGEGTGDGSRAKAHIKKDGEQSDKGEEL